jgi:dolichol-phosphate mannosyltransferase
LPAAPALALVIGKFFEDLLWPRAGIKWDTYTTRWAPWLATGTSLVAAIGIVSFGAWSGLESPNKIVLVAASGLAMVFAGISLRRYLQRPEVSWGICVVTTLGVAGVVFHREIPRYAVAQSLFGTISPLREQFTLSPDVPIVTVGHEWSEVPFYLDRNDITNLDNLGAADLVHQDHQASHLLVLARRAREGNPGLPELPPGVRVASLTERGRARLMLLEIVPQDGMIHRSVQQHATFR